MKRSRWLTALLLAGIVVAIVAALFAQAASGPTFRAGEHATFPDCMASIPGEWAPGSLERSGAEEACRYVHLPPPPRGPE
jgi:hypothetical protein